MCEAFGSIEGRHEYSCRLSADGACSRRCRLDGEPPHLRVAFVATRKQISCSRFVKDIQVRARPQVHLANEETTKETISNQRTCLGSLKISRFPPASCLRCGRNCSLGVRSQGSLRLPSGSIVSNRGMATNLQLSTQRDAHTAAFDIVNAETHQNS